MKILREKIADILLGEDDASSDEIVGAFQVADAILAIPEIAEALAAKQHEAAVQRSRNLGHSISTGTRRG